MYDFVRLFTKVVPSTIYEALQNGDREPIFYKGIEYGYDGRNIDNPKYEGWLGNLQIQHSLGGSRLQNSIHKYFDNYNNTDFYLSNVKKAFEKISDETLIDWRKSNVISLEIGCNTIEPYNDFIIDRLYTYGSRNFIQMDELPFRGAKCKTTNFTLKSYNKFFETPDYFKPKPKLHRTEIRYKWVKKSFPFINSAEDLYKIENALLLRKDFLHRFQKVVFLEMPDLLNLSIKDKTIIARYSNPIIADAIKIQHFATFKQEIKRFRELMKNDEGIINKYLTNISDKTEELIYS